MLVRSWKKLVPAAFAAGLCATACAHPAVVNVPHALAPVRGITVMGVGEAKAPPDIARTNIGVEVRSDTVEQATAQANQRMAAILDALRKLGIADKDLRTHSFSISFEQQPMPPWPQPQPQTEPEPRSKAAPGAPAVATPAPDAVRGVYRASNMLEVTIRDLSTTGHVLQAATDAGANNVWGISFELEDPKPLLAQARVKAVEHAKQNADALAKLSGVELGPVLAISEGSGGNGPVPPTYAMKAMDASGGDVPVERGEVTVTQQVQMVYALPE